MTFLNQDYAPPLGLMYLKSYLKNRTDAEVRLFNFQVHRRPSYSDFKNALIEYRPNLVGITIYSTYWYDACQVAKLVKKTLPQTLVAAGGSHMWNYPAETLSRDEFDIVVVGEGEITFTELVRRLESGDDLDGLPGICYKSGNQIISNPPRSVEPHLDHFPFPDRSALHVRQHRVPSSRWSPAAVVLTSRGCPQHCTFCQNNDHLYRTRQPKKVIEEILHCKGMGYRSVDFYDSNFNQSRKHVESLCQEMIDHRLNLPWICQCRVDRMDRDLIQLMASAGCYRIYYGVESANQKYLDQIKKGITVEQCREVFALTKEAGISTLAYFIIGFPGETMEEAMRTISFAFEMDPDYAMFTPLIPVPGTPLYDEALKDRAFGEDYGQEFAFNPVPDFRLKMWPTAMTEEQILTLLRQAFLKFYFRPRYIGRSILRLTSLKDLIAKTKMAVKILLTY